MAKEKRITRTFTTTNIIGAKVEGIEDGKIVTTPVAPISVAGKITVGKAAKMLADYYDPAKEGHQFVVVDIHYNTDTYAIPEEIFLKHAVRVQPANVIIENEQEA